MVDVSGKPDTEREAELSPGAHGASPSNLLKKAV